MEQADKRIIPWCECRFQPENLMKRCPKVLIDENRCGICGSKLLWLDKSIDPPKKVENNRKKAIKQYNVKTEKKHVQKRLNQFI